MKLLQNIVNLPEKSGHIKVENERILAEVCKWGNE